MAKPFSLLEGRDFIVDFMRPTNNSKNKCFVSESNVDEKQECMPQPKPQPAQDNLEFAKTFFPEYFVKKPSDWKECRYGKSIGNCWKTLRHYEYTSTENQTGPRQSSPLIEWFGQEFGLPTDFQVRKTTMVD
jgi:hypothetical protein